MNITEPLSVIARETPDAPAVLTAEGSLSFAELDRAVSWAAASFRKAGLAPGDIAGINLPSQTQHLITSLALARLGAGQLSFHDSDPPKLRQELVRRVGMAATVADGSIETGTQTGLVDPPPASLRDLKGLEPVEVAVASDGELPLLLQRTSGTTTGIPNVGRLTHAAAHKRFKSFPFGLVAEGPGSRYLALSSLSFDGTKYNNLRSLMTGECVAFLERRNTPQALVDFVTEHRINNLACVPVHAATLLGIAKEGTILLPDVEAFILSSTLIPQAIRENVQKRLTPNLFIGCGMMEIGYVAMAPPALVRNVPGVIGKLLPGVQGEVVDEDGNPLPPGKAGRLRLKSAGMIEGYVDAPDDTARAFRDGWFYSGDLAEFTVDGALIHHGRADDLMIFDGINIFPAEIENVLLRHPAVSEAAAFPIHSVARGDIPIAAVVTRSQVTADELKSHCQSWLGVRAPQSLVVVSRLPRNAAGKVMKHELAAEFQRRLQRTRRS